MIRELRLLGKPGNLSRFQFLEIVKKTKGMLATGKAGTTTGNGAKGISQEER